LTNFKDTNSYWSWKRVAKSTRSKLHMP